MLYLSHKSLNQTPALERPLRATDGYLFLGMPEEALEAIASIPEPLQMEPSVLRARVRILLHLAQWRRAEHVSRQGMSLYPEENEFVVQRAFALHQMKKGEEAIQIIQGAPEWIRRTGILHYNLACYEAQLGDIGIARQCIRAAIEINSAFRKNAKADPDLQRLWN